MTKTLKKLSKKTLSQSEKILTTAGIIVLALTAVATLFTFMTSHPFIREPIDLGYYARFVITVIGGFGVGLLFSQFNASGKNKKVSVFTGISFGLLTYAIFLLLDYSRLPLRELFGTPDYPWGKLLFEGISIAALLIVALVAAVALYRKKAITTASNRFKWIFIGVFTLLQIAMFIANGLISTHAEVSAMTFLIGFLALITTPFAIAVITYVALKKISDTVTRLFYAAFIAQLYQVTQLVLWEFRTNPDHQATIVFSFIVGISVFVAAIALIFATHRSLRK